MVPPRPRAWEVGITELALGHSQMAAGTPAPTRIAKSYVDSYSNQFILPVRDVGHTLLTVWRPGLGQR